jgi:putative transposase
MSSRRPLPKFLKRTGRRVSRAHRAIPGLLVFATRRTLDRRFLLRPDRELMAVLIYLLGVAARKHGIKIHELTIMSSHIHILFTDSRGKRGSFFCDFHSWLAKAVQQKRGWTKPVFDKRQTNQPEVVTQQGAIEAAAYIRANAVLAGLVERPELWPGNVTALEDVGHGSRIVVRRPDVLHREDGRAVRFFDEDNDDWPEEVALEIVPLAKRLDMDPEECIARVRAEQDALVEEKRREVEGTRGRFLGRLRALRRSPFACATTSETFGDLEPRVKAGRHQGEARRAALDDQFDGSLT